MCAECNDAPGIYYPALGRVVAEVRVPKWTEEICSARFPDTKARIGTAYRACRARNATFIGEMDGQFAVIERTWRRTLVGNTDVRTAVRLMSDGINQYNPQLGAQFAASGDRMFRQICMLYPERVVSPNIELEKILSSDVAVIRRGPDRSPR